jgi:hypothetical protein
MKIQRLVYHGKREEGVLSVGRIDVLSPWRKFKFYKGLNFKIGKIVPLDVAEILARDYPSLFRIETEDLNEKDSYVYHLSDAIEECLASLGDKVALEVMGEVIKKNFKGWGIVDMNVKREGSPKPKPKPRRRKK